MFRIIFVDVNPEVEEDHIIELGLYEQVRIVHGNVWARTKEGGKELIAHYDAEMDRWVHTKKVPGTNTFIQLTYTDIILEPVNADEDKDA